MEIRDLVRERIVGNIKIGTKSEKGLPKKLSCFHVEEDKATSRDMVDIFKKLYPEKTRKLKIRFTSENPFNFKYKRYVNNKAICIGNGTKAITIGKDNNNKNTQIEVECSKECEHIQSGKCKLRGSLKFVLEGIEAGGVWNLSTSGGISLSNIASEIVKYKKAGMSIIGVPFELTLTEQESLAYGTYYSIDLHGLDQKPQLVDSTTAKLNKANVVETKKLPEETQKGNTIAQKTIKEKDVKENEPKEEKLSKTNKEQKENMNNKPETNTKEDFSNYYVLKSYMETIIKGKKFDQFTFEKMDGQEVEYILHPKANKEINNCDVGTLIEVIEEKMEMEKNVLCLYNIKQKIEKAENNEDNSEELKEAV